MPAPDAFGDSLRKRSVLLVAPMVGVRCSPPVPRLIGRAAKGRNQSRLGFDPRGSAGPFPPIGSTHPRRAAEHPISPRRSCAEAKLSPAPAEPTAAERSA
jgi:hypothetical protein